MKNAIGGVTAVPTYAILNFHADKVEVFKFEGCTAMESGVFEARLRDVAKHREREREARQAAQMLGDIFSIGFAAAELEALKKKQAEKEKQEREQQTKLQQEALTQQEHERQVKEKQEKARLQEIAREQERRQQEEDRLKNRPQHVQELLALDLNKAPIREIKSLMEKMHISHVGCTSRQDLKTQLVQQVPELRLKHEKETEELAAQTQWQQENVSKPSPNKLSVSASDLKLSTVYQLKATLEELGISSKGYTSKEDMIHAIVDAQIPRTSSEQVNQLRAQHVAENLKSDKERLQLQVQQLEKRLIQSEDREKRLNQELSEAQGQAKIAEKKAAAAELQSRKAATEVASLKQQNSELKLAVEHAARSGGAMKARTTSNSSLPGYLNKSPEERVKELERAMLDMTILFTTKAEDYDVVKLIDCGCEGAVHLVRCTRPELGDTERLYALKTVFNIFGHQTVSKVRQQHENEYQTLAILPKHPNIVNLFAFFFDRLDSNQFQLPAESTVQARSISLFMIMEYQPRTLKTYVDEKSKTGGVQASEILSWTFQLLMAIDFLNARNVVHRDLKMDNILYSNEGVVKLCDFGYSIQLEPGMKMPLTAGMGKGGNAAHLAPEVHNSRPGRGRMVDYSKQSVWAMGVLCYEMCNHPSPFEGVLDQCGYDSKDIPPLMRVQTSTGAGAVLPADYQELVKSLLHFEPQLRPSPAEALRKLKLLLDQTIPTQMNRF